MKIIELKHVAYLERIIKSLFPNLWSVFLYILLAIGFSYLFNLNPTDKIFWIISIIYIPVPFYLILLKPYLESKIYITNIELDITQNEIKIEYLEYQSKKHITVSVKQVTYNTFSSVKISLADRIIFYDGKKELLRQYSNSGWSIAKINDVAKSLDKIGIKKPYGYNK